MKRTFLLLISDFITVLLCAQTGVSQFSDPTGMYSTISSGLCVCSFSNVANIADNDLGNFATVNVAASVFGATRSIKAKLNNTVPGNTKAGFYINAHFVISLLPTVSIKTYKAGALQETIISNGDMITLAGGSAGNLCGTTSVSKPYDEVELIFNMGLVTATSAIDVYYAFGGFNSCPGFALPVRLIDINATVQDGFPVITWSAQNDEDTFYDLQRSEDGNPFKTIFSNRVNTGSRIEKFSFIDKTPLNNKVYYRLAINSNDLQRTSYSKIVDINLSGYTGYTGQIYPNPSSGRELYILLNGNNNKKYQLQIFNNSGILVANEPVKSMNISTGIIWLKKQLTPGIYYTRLTETGSTVAYYYGKFSVIN